MAFGIRLVLPALVLAFTVSTAHAQPPREIFRYDGKTFDQWKSYLPTELKAERRIEALKAMQAFGVRGYGVEAAEAVVAAMRDHFREFGDNQRHPVWVAACDALIAINEPAVPILLATLKDGDVRLGNFSRDVLDCIPNPKNVPSLMNIVAHGSQRSAVLAMYLLSSGLKGHGYKPAILEQLKNEEVRKAYFQALEQSFPNSLADIKLLGTAARPIAPALLKLLKVPCKEVYIMVHESRTTPGPILREQSVVRLDVCSARIDALATLIKVEADPAQVSPVIVAELDKLSANSERAFEHRGVLYLVQHRVGYKEVGPIFNKLFKTSRGDEFTLDGKPWTMKAYLSQALGEFGPAASGSLPLLEDLRENGNAQEREEAAKAIKKIKGEK